MEELYKNKTLGFTNAERNTAILRRLENDISALSKEVKDLKKTLEFITQYIKLKKEREDAKWFY
tara:strand:+ start:347 stop:538 length:192 start_codon:yes stop_codon:yes gene_type:complete